MPDSENTPEGWHEEKRSAYLYRVMAEAEAGTPRAALFGGLAAEAENQAGIWARQSRAAVPEFAPDLRARLVAALVRRKPRNWRSSTPRAACRGRFGNSETSAAQICMCAGFRRKFNLLPRDNWTSRRQMPGPKRNYEISRNPQ